MSGQDLDAVAIDNFRNYLRIPSVHPNVNYDECVKFLSKQAALLGLELQVHEVVPKKPIVILTWKGQEPEKASILLNSHTDVVPVFPDLWTHNPFGADMDSKGDIYARGSQDMKCVGIQYLETVRRLKAAGRKLKRTLHLSFVPDEETGGVDGMKQFVHTQEFKNLNVGFALDEGMASATEDFKVYYGERAIWHAEFTCPGTEGHGSLLMEDTAGVKVMKLINLLMAFRQVQVDRLKDNPELTVGDVTTVNLTMLKGGVEPNVVPPELKVTFDIRLAIDVNHEEFESKLKAWMAEAGEGITVNFQQKNGPVSPTAIDATNRYWQAMKQELDNMKLSYKTLIFPGGTDSRYCRKVGIPAIGYSPINNTPVLLHANDEYLNKSVFLKGIDIYMNIIPAVANI